MERPPARVLLIDENREQALWIDSLFGRMAVYQWELSRVETADEALARLATCEFDVCIIDSRVGGDGLSLVRSARKSGCLKPIIVLIDGGTPVDLPRLSKRGRQTACSRIISMRFGWNGLSATRSIDKVAEGSGV